MAKVRKIDQHLQQCNATAKLARLSCDYNSQNTSRQHSLSARGDPPLQYRPQQQPLVEHEENNQPICFPVGAPSSPTVSHSSRSDTELKASTINANITNTNMSNTGFYSHAGVLRSSGNQSPPTSVDSPISQPAEQYEWIDHEPSQYYRRKKFGKILTWARSMYGASREHQSMTVQAETNVGEGTGFGDDTVEQTWQPDCVYREEEIHVVSTL